jgi:sn-glycerol 3-phosphate transport system permease protein
MSRYLVLVAVAVAVLFPVYAAIMVSQKPLAELGDLGVLAPSRPRLDAFPDALGDRNLGRYLVNSLIVAGSITLGQVVTSILAGYAFAHLRLPGRGVLFGLFLATLMVPTEVTVVANLETVQKLGWIDTYQGLIVPFLAFGLGAFVLRQAFLGVPRDLRDAAAMDGYGHWGYLWRVGVPLVRSSIAATAVVSFLLAWNQYLWPLLVTNDERRRTVQVGLRALGGEAGAQLNVVMAGTLLAAVPILILLIVFERQLVRGLTAGAVKG